MNNDTIIKYTTTQGYEEVYAGAGTPRPRLCQTPSLPQYKSVFLEEYLQTSEPETPPPSFMEAVKVDFRSLSNPQHV